MLVETEEDKELTCSYCLGTSYNCAVKWRAGVTGDPRSSLCAGDGTNLPGWVDVGFTPTCA